MTEEMLSQREVHIWQASLEQPSTVMAYLYSLLSIDEQAKAAKFYFERDRKHFIAARGILRVILGRYLNSNPTALSFGYSTYGKPFLTQPSTRLNFNLSHSHGMAVYGVTYVRDIGVDIEQLRPLADAEQIAERFFAKQESELFAALPMEVRTTAFFNCWTSKEAYIKAIGEGLSHPLDKFNVSFLPTSPAALLWVEGIPQASEHWCLWRWHPAIDYVATLAIAAKGLSFTLWQWAETTPTIIEKGQF